MNRTKHVNKPYLAHYAKKWLNTIITLMMFVKESYYRSLEDELLNEKSPSEEEPDSDFSSTCKERNQFWIITESWEIADPCGKFPPPLTVMLVWAESKRITSHWMLLLLCWAQFDSMNMWACVLETYTCLYTCRSGCVCGIYTGVCVCTGVCVWEELGCCLTWASACRAAAAVSMLMLRKSWSSWEGRGRGQSPPTQTLTHIHQIPKWRFTPLPAQRQSIPDVWILLCRDSAEPNPQKQATGW